VTYSLVAWSLLVELVGGVVEANHWLLDTSVFHQMAPAPAADPNWTTSLGLVAVGLVAGVVGAVAFARRDLRGA
jgi:putative exporter of polyketide antibiotics